MGEEQNRWEYERLAEVFIRLIRAGTFRPGDRLPSLRMVCRQQQVSVATALSAYYRLEAQGWIEARPRSGFFVNITLPRSMPEPEISSPDLDPTQVSVRDLVNQVVLRDAANPNLIQLGAAHPNPILTAGSAITRHISSLARRMGEACVQYDPLPGCEPLRVQIAQRAAINGCTLSPADLITTIGCAEAISLSLRAVCRPGDTVAIESPTCVDALRCLEVLDLRALEIPTHPRDGISLEALRFAVQHHPVRACLVISNYHNPLGGCISDENKRELVRMLAQQDIPLIENDINGELYFGDKRPTIAKAYDRKGLVMLCSSFSKDMGPGYRVGWVAPGRFKSTVEWQKYAFTLATPTLPQYAMAEFMADGGYDRHVRRIRLAYARNIAAMHQAITREFPASCRSTRPAGGFLLWVQLPEGLDSLDLYRRALSAGVAIMPGHLFSASQQYRDFIRLNAANWTDGGERAIKILGTLIAEMSGGRT